MGTNWNRAGWGVCASQKFSMWKPCPLEKAWTEGDTGHWHLSFNHAFGQVSHLLFPNIWHSGSSFLCMLCLIYWCFIPVTTENEPLASCKEGVLACVHDRSLLWPSVTLLVTHLSSQNGSPVLIGMCSFKPRMEKDSSAKLSDPLSSILCTDQHQHEVCLGWPQAIKPRRCWGVKYLKVKQPVLGVRTVAVEHSSTGHSLQTSHDLFYAGPDGDLIWKFTQEMLICIT